MRDYGVARTIFSIVEFVFWAGVVLGVIAAFASMGAASRGFGAAPGIIAAIPGIAITLVSLFGVASTQMGRATVDSAEYGQQALKVARDQLEVSKQGIKQGTGLENSFADLARRLGATADGSATSERMATVPKSSGYSAPKSDSELAGNNQTAPKIEDESPKPYANQLGANPAAKQEPLTYDINGKRLTQNSDGTFNFEGNRFVTLDAVKEHMRLKSISAVSARPQS